MIARFGLALPFALAPLAFASPQGGGAASGTGFPGLGVGHRPRVEIPWNRYYDTSELFGLLDRLEQAFPGYLSHEVIGHSVEGRELRVYTLNDPETGPAEAKPAMWVDANVHGNEIQGGEVAVYLVWYLLENDGHVQKVSDLLDRVAFYVQPSINPDGRDHWLHDAHSAHSSRTGYAPVDDDLDGAFDEDPPNDLDGDGHIVLMRKYVPGEGTHRLDPDDPRILIPVPPNDEGRRGDWVILGQEGYDDDGDGRVNEDGPGGYDMNRAWPALWQPEHVQYGAGPYPLFWPETRAVAEFLLAHPNVAAVQSFHNAGGMILRGPGAEEYGSYPSADVSVYDALGSDGERMLPFYRYMVIWKDLYSVFGGFVNWTYEGLGIISFTNELWTNRRNFPDGGNEPSEGPFRRGARRIGGGEQQWFDDHLLQGAGYVNWHPVQHPLYGEIEVGGFRKDVGRVAPTFLIEEMLHRNAMFCIDHASAMPEVVIESVEVSTPGDGLVAVDARFVNRRLIPTRTALAANKRVGRPDVFGLEGEGIEVLAGGFRSDRWRPERIELAEHEPARLVLERGIGSRDEVWVRWIVRGAGEARVFWSGEKGRDVESRVEIP